MANYCANAVEIRGESKQLEKFIDIHIPKEEQSKASEKFEVKSDNKGSYLLFQNETPWTPFSKDYIKNLAGSVEDITLKHVYAESGVGFCGIHMYEKGELTHEEICNEFSYDNVPKYISDSYLDSYGG